MLAAWGSTRKADTTVHDGVLTVEAAQPWKVFVWKVLGDRRLSPPIVPFPEKRRAQAPQAIG